MAASLTSELQRQQFQEDGFLIIRQFLNATELKELQTNLQRYIEQTVPLLPDGDAFFEDRTRPETLKQLSRMEQDAWFAGYRVNPRWNGVAAELLGDEVRAHGVEWFNKPPATQHPTPPHQDNYYFCLTPPHVLTMWLALDDVDEENGCLRYVRGSHLRGVRPHGRTATLGFSQGIADFGEEDVANETVVIAQPGDLLIHHGNTIHRAECNRSTVRHRRSFAMVFQGIQARRDDVAFERYLTTAKSQHSALGLKT